MNESENNSSFLSNLVGAMPLKIKLIILVIVFIFFLIIIPVLLISIISSNNFSYEYDKKQESTGSESQEGTIDNIDDETIIGGKPSKMGYIFPVANLSRKNINNLRYPSYKGHTGVDVNIGVKGGKKAVAVKERNCSNINSFKK